MTNFWPRGGWQISSGALVSLRVHTAVFFLQANQLEWVQLQVLRKLLFSTAASTLTPGWRAFLTVFLLPHHPQEERRRTSISPLWRQNLDLSFSGFAQFLEAWTLPTELRRQSFEDGDPPLPPLLPMCACNASLTPSDYIRYILIRCHISHEWARAGQEQLCNLLLQDHAHIHCWSRPTSAKKKIHWLTQNKNNFFCLSADHSAVE